MGPVVASEAAALYGGRTGVAVLLIATAGVAGTVLALYGLWRLLRADELRSYRFLAVTFLVLHVFFVATAGRPYYLGGLYAVLAAAGALGLQRRRESGGRRWRWAAWPAYALSAAAAAAMLGASLEAVAESDRIGEGIAQRTAAAYGTLPPDQRARTAIMGQSYVVAAYLDGYSTQYGLPQAHSGNRGYGWSRPRPRTPTRCSTSAATPTRCARTSPTCGWSPRAARTPTCSCAPAGGSPGRRSGRGCAA